MLFTNLRLIKRSRFEPIVLLPAHGPAEEILDDLGISHQVWGRLQEPDSIAIYTRTLLRAIFWFIKNRVSLIHMNRANDWRPAEYLAARICRIPIITHFHMVNHDRAPATSMTTAVATVSDFVARKSDTLGIPTTVIYNSVNLKRFSGGKNIRASLGFTENEVIVTFVGQVRAIKGVEDFIAMAKLVDGQQVRFLIAGECRNNPAIEDAFSEEQLNSMISNDRRICYCGYQKRIEDVYQSSDIVVVPSRWDEPFGLILIEAGAASKAVVATRVGGIPEVVRDGECGYLVDKGDVVSMSKRVQQLVDDPSLREKFGKAALDHVEREFTEKPVRRLERLYDELLGVEEAERLRQ